MADFEQDDVIRIGAQMQYDASEDVVNVYHVRLVAGGGFDFSFVAGIVQDYMDGVMATLDTELSTLMLANVLQITNVTQATVFGAIAWGVFAQGGAAGEPCAAGTSCFGFARTRTPRVQIRKYYGVFPQSALLDGRWDAGVTGAVADSLDYHIADQDMGSGAHLLGVAWNRTLLTSTPAITVAVRDEPAYQRRRKRGSGS